MKDIYSEIQCSAVDKNGKKYSVIRRQIHGANKYSKVYMEKREKLEAEK